MSRLVGYRKVMLGEAEEQLDTQVMPLREYRRAQEAVEGYRQQVVGNQRDHYARTQRQYAEAIDYAERNIAAGRESLTEIRRLRKAGELKGRDGLREMAELIETLDHDREELRKLLDAEERNWGEVSMDPAAYQRAMAQRQPAIHQGGRGLLSFPVYSDD